MEDYTKSSQYRAAISDLEQIIRTKNPEQRAQIIIERYKNQPFGEEILQKAEYIKGVS